MNSNNFILFGGIPRSGTTLTCHLFNQCPNSHALVESMDIAALVKLPTAEERKDFIYRYMSDSYAKIKAKEPISINAIDGQNTNTFSENTAETNEKRQNKIVKKQPTVITRHLNDNFKLILKHPNAFIALLPELQKTFTIFAQIRNPLSILASWNSIAHPLNKGYAPMAEAVDNQLKSRLARVANDLDRQIALLDWYYTVIYNSLAPDKIIKYEDIIATNGDVLSQIVQQPCSSKTALDNRNSNILYNREYMKDAFTKLLNLTHHACWKFYSVADIKPSDAV